MLEESLKAPQIASGDLLRAAVRDGTALGIKAKGYMDRGELVPDELVLGLIGERIDRDARNGFILDGFPRNASQAESLAKMLEERGLKLDRVAAIIVPDEEIVGRISGRRTCKCGAMYHVKFDPPSQQDTCDKCGGKLFQRDDDQEATVRNRLRVYDESTRPLLDYYSKRGVLVEIDGTGKPEEVGERILAAVGGTNGSGEQAG